MKATNSPAIRGGQSAKTGEAPLSCSSSSSIRKGLNRQIEDEDEDENDRTLPRRAASNLQAVLAVLVLFGCALLARAADKINYTDHVLPLIQANCSKCHNSDKKKADLDLTSYQGALKGSGSGAIVLAGNADGSKLWKALTHAEEPFMPPNRPKLSDQELEVFKQWILGGLLETANGRAIAVAKSGVDLTLKPEALVKPDGPPPMPAELPIEPVLHTSRGGAITGLAASPWAPLIAVAGQKEVLLFHTDTLELLGILPFDEGQPLDLKFSRNGRLLLAAGGRAAKSGCVVVWDIVTGEHLMTLGQEFDCVLAADIRPDQSQVALGGPSRLVKIFSTTTGELQHKIKKHTDWVSAVAYSPNGQSLATADRNGGISLWDPENAQELFTLTGHKSAVTALSWRADSKLLASASEDGTVRLWDVQEGKQIKSWTANSSGSLCVSYAWDGRLVTCGRDNAVTVWDGNGAKPRHFEFFGNLPLRAVFSSDGQRVFATDFAGRVGLWSTSDGKRVGELNPDPLPLADQIAAVQTRIHSLEADASQPSSNDAALAVAGTNPGLAEARRQLNRLRAAQLLTSAYRLRSNLSVRKREHERMAASLEASNQALLKAERDFAKAREAAANAQAQIKAASAEIARTEPSVRQMAESIKAQQEHLETLLERYHAATGNLGNVAKQSR